MIHTALNSGVPWRDAGSMTAEEIAFCARSKQEQNKEFAQALAWIVYNGAALTGVAVNEPKRFPRLEDAFPSLFEQKEQQDWRVMKDRIASYAKGRKAQRG